MIGNTVVQTDTHPSAEVIGLHPVDAPEPCVLVEMLIHGTRETADLGLVTQPIAGRTESEWQVAYDERFLDSAGRNPVDAPIPGHCPAGGDVRGAFFFHYIDVGRPLSTPWGDVPLPAMTDRPDRLAFMVYEPPC